MTVVPPDFQRPPGEDPHDDINIFVHQNPWPDTDPGEEAE